MSEQNEKESKIFIGKILGEIYRTQLHLGMSTASDATIYGLLNGIETVAEEELQGISVVSKEHLHNVAEVLDEIFLSPEKLDAFKGYYDIEGKLQERGVDRMTALTAMKYFYANRQFVEVISKMNSSHSPVECKTFEIDKSDFV
jgi:hypothetical protein